MGTKPDAFEFPQEWVPNATKDHWLRFLKNRLQSTRSELLPTRI